MSKQPEEKGVAQNRESFGLRHRLQRLTVAFTSFFADRTNLLPASRFLCSFRQVFKRKTALIVVFTAFLVVNMFLLSSIVGQVLYSVTLQNHGVIKTVGVVAYCDEDCTELISDFDWGKILPGSSSTNTIYLKNDGNSAITLSLYTAHWIPSVAAEYMTLTWDYMGQTVSPNQVIEITLTLSVESGITEIDAFTFDIEIVGTG